MENSIQWRIVWMFLGKKMHTEDISELCYINKRSIRCYIDQFKQTGKVKPTASQSCTNS